MSATTDSKKQTVASIIDGQIVDDADRVAVLIKGTVDGFPATLEAIYASWPFGVVYTLETTLVEDPARKAELAADHTRITIAPRIGRGPVSILTKLLLFESSGMPVGDKRLEKLLNFSYDDRDMTERFIHYPGVTEHLLNLNSIAKFSELIVRPSAGIYLAQPNSFNSLDYEVCRNTFKTLGALGKVLFEAF